MEFGEAAFTLLQGRKNEENVLVFISDSKTLIVNDKLHPRHYDYTTYRFVPNPSNLELITDVLLKLRDKNFVVILMGENTGLIRYGVRFASTPNLNCKGIIMRIPQLSCFSFSRSGLQELVRAVKYDTRSIPILLLGDRNYVEPLVQTTARLFHVVEFDSDEDVVWVIEQIRIFLRTSFAVKSFDEV